MIAEENTIPSPCIRNCCLNEDNICLGCFRSLDEICNWSNADRQLRLQILNNAGQRQLRHAAQFRLNKGLISDTPTTSK